MSSINRVGINNPVARVINNPVQKSLPTDPATASRASDRLELSGLSHLLKAARSNDIRGDMVASIKSQIEAGTYESESKLDVAADRLLDDLAR